MELGLGFKSSVGGVLGGWVLIVLVVELLGDFKSVLFKVFELIRCEGLLFPVQLHGFGLVFQRLLLGEFVLLF